MSLVALADHMAAKGRGGDSMLVHMSPQEVQALQALAQRHGKSLTINPETGQPEAFSLKSLLPAIAGFALGPAGFGLMSAGMAGAAVGGVTALATGSLSRGLMAGLGAYGGAGLGEALTGAGTGALAANEIAAQQAAGTFPTLAEGATQAQIADYTNQVNTLREAALKKAGEAGLGERLSAGFGQVASNPAAYAKDAFKFGSAAASPIMADAMVQTTTGLPTLKQTPAYIRPYVVDQYSQQMQALRPIDASTIRLRDTNYADGGIVALAEGGQSNFAFGDHPSVKEFMDATGSDFQTAANMIYGVVGSNTDTRDWESIMGAKDPVAAARSATNEMYGGVRIGDYTDPATKTTAPMLFSASGVPLTSGISRAADFGYVAAPTAASAATTALPTAPMAAAGSPARAGVDAFQIGAGQDATASKYLSDNPDVAAWLASSEGKAWAAQNPSYDPSDIAWTHYVRYGANEGRQWGAPVQTTTPMPSLSSTPAYTGGNQTVPGGAAEGWTATTPASYAPTGTTNPFGNGVTPGDLTYTPLPGPTAPATVTTQPPTTGTTPVAPPVMTTVTPNIPGRPYGGFAGVQQVKDAYTAGGGSLGQTNLFVPKTIEEFNTRYTNSGGSQQAYDYLANKGAASINVPVTRGQPIMRPYTEAVMGIPAPRIAMPRKPGAASAVQTITQMPGTEAANGGVMRMALGGLGALAGGGQAGYNLGGYSDGGRLLRGPGDGVSDSIPATIGDKQPARLADGEFVVPARIVSELGNGSTEAGARKLYAMMDRVQRARGKTTGKGKVAKDTSAEKYLPA